MKRSLIRYKTKAESADQNVRLIEKVFEELQGTSPQGVRYLVLRLDDGSFVHLVVGETDEGTRPLTRLPAFERFSQGIGERCVEPPQSSAATIVGNYRMLA